jgi:bacterioferritin-associated ferredoxin
VYVCSCRAVTDGVVKTVIASGATSVEDIARRCGAGARCRGCWPELERLLAEHRARVAGCDSRVAV